MKSYFLYQKEPAFICKEFKTKSLEFYKQEIKLQKCLLSRKRNSVSSMFMFGCMRPITLQFIIQEQSVILKPATILFNSHYHVIVFYHWKDPSGILKLLETNDVTFYTPGCVNPSPSFRKCLPHDDTSGMGK